MQIQSQNIKVFHHQQKKCGIMFIHRENEGYYWDTMGYYFLPTAIGPRALSLIRPVPDPKDPKRDPSLRDWCPWQLRQSATVGHLNSWFTVPVMGSHRNSVWKWYRRYGSIMRAWCEETPERVILLRTASKSSKVWSNPWIFKLCRYVASHPVPIAIDHADTFEGEKFHQLVNRHNVVKRWWGHTLAPMMTIINVVQTSWTWAKAS